MRMAFFFMQYTVYTTQGMIISRWTVKTQHDSNITGHSGVNYGRNASKTCNVLHNDPCYFTVQSCQPSCCQSNKTKTKQQLKQLALKTNPDTVYIRSWDKTQQHLKALHLITIFLSGRVSHFNDSRQGANLPRFLTGTTLQNTVKLLECFCHSPPHPTPSPLLVSSSSSRVLSSRLAAL